MGKSKKTEEETVQVEEQNTLSLEEAFVQMEEIVKKLESQDITLEDSFLSYKKGMEILQYCNGKIDQVEKKVLVIDESGKLNEF